MNTETLSPPLVEGNGTETPPQETPPGSQEPAKPQETEPRQVEPSVNPPQDTETPSKVSGYYKMRDKIRHLESALSERDKQTQELYAFYEQFKKKDSDVSKNQFDPQRFLADPATVYAEDRERLLKEIEDMRSQFNQLRDTHVSGQMEREKQEALELLFPKASSDDATPAQARVEKNPERAARIQELFDEIPTLKQMIDSKPLEAAKIINRMLKDDKAPTASPKAIPKSLMGGTARGGGGGKSGRNVKDVMAEIKKLSAEEAENTALRFDAERRKRKEALYMEAEKLAQEERR